MWEGERPEDHNLQLNFAFKDWNYFRNHVQRKQDRVHLQLGFWGHVENEDGGGYRLRQEVIEYDWPDRSWAHKPFLEFGKRHQPKELRHHVRFFHHEAADLARRISRSESISWTDRRTGETETITVGEKSRRAIEQVMGLCGFSVNEVP